MESERSPFVNWVWVAGIATTIVVLFCAALARAGTAKVTFDPPTDPDLKQCRVYVTVDGNEITSKTVLAAQLVPGTVVDLPVDTVALQNKTGRYLSVCEDLAGNFSVESAPIQVPFPDLAPGAGSVRSVQVLP